MKRHVLAVLVVVLVLVGAVAFTEGKFTAWNQGDLFLFINNDSGGTKNGWGPLWDNTTGIDQEWTFSFDGNGYGFSGTLEFGMDNIGNTGPVTAAFAPPTISWFSTYYKFGDIVKLTIGKPRVGDYTIGSFLEGNLYNRVMNSQFGALVQVYPISGLSVGGALFVPNANPFTNAVGIDYANNFAVGASYAFPDLMTLAAFYKAAGAPGTVAKTLDIGVNVTAMKNLGVAAAYEGNFSDSSNMINTAFVSAKYTVSPALAVAIDAALKSIETPSTTSFAIEGNAEYQLGGGPYGVGLTVGYDDGKGVAWFDQGVGNYTGFELWPYAIAHFDNGSYTKLGFIYASGANDLPSRMALALYYVWAF